MTAATLESLCLKPAATVVTRIRRTGADGARLGVRVYPVVPPAGRSALWLARPPDLVPPPGSEARREGSAAPIASGGVPAILAPAGLAPESADRPQVEVTGGSGRGRREKTVPSDLVLPSGRMLLRGEVGQGSSTGTGSGAAPGAATGGRTRAEPVASAKIVGRASRVPPAAGGTTGIREVGSDARARNGTPEGSAQIAGTELRTARAASSRAGDRRLAGAVDLSADRAVRLIGAAAGAIGDGRATGVAARSNEEAGRLSDRDVPATGAGRRATGARPATGAGRPATAAVVPTSAADRPAIAVSGSMIAGDRPATAVDGRTTGDVRRATGVGGRTTEVGRPLTVRVEASAAVTAATTAPPTPVTAAVGTTRDRIGASPVLTPIEVGGVTKPIAVEPPGRPLEAGVRAGPGRP